MRLHLLLRLGTEMDPAEATALIHLWDLDMILCMFSYDFIVDLLCVVQIEFENFISWDRLLRCSALAKFISKPADGGITALHIAALNGYVECVQLLLDLHANVSAVTFHYGSSMNLIGMKLLSFVKIFVKVYDFELVSMAGRSGKHSFALCGLWRES